jgi:hypothetical protein
MPIAPLARPIPRLLRNSQPPSEEEERSLMRDIGGGFLSGIGMLGNVLDLPASMVRDVATLQNPFDQWLSPTTPENRARGRDVLTDWFGMRKNNETGIKGWLDDPGEGARDLAGFGAEVLMDPLSWLTFGGQSLTRGAGQATKRAGLLPVVDRLRQGGIQEGLVSENIKRLRASGGFLGPRRARQETNLQDVIRAAPDSTAAMADLQTAAGAMGRNLSDLMDEPLGHHFGLAVPFMDPFTTFNAGPIGRGLSQGFDVAGNALKNMAGIRHIRGLLNPAMGGQTDRVGQEIAETAYNSKQAANATAAGTNLDATDEFNRLAKNFSRELGGGVLPNPEHYHPHDLDTAIGEVLPGMELDWQFWEPLRRFRAEHPEWVQAAFRGRSDYTQFPHHDEIANWFRENAPEWGNSLDFDRVLGAENASNDIVQASGPIQNVEDLWRILSEGNHESLHRNRPRRNSPDVIERAERHLRNVYGDQPTPFRQGDVVRTGDRGNYGYVIQAGRDRSTVFFRNPETGMVATPQLDNSGLARAFDDPNEAAKASERAAQIYQRDMVGNLLRATTELGSAERAFRELTPGLEPTPEILEQFTKTAESLATQRNAVYQSVLDKGGNGRMLNEGFDEADDMTKIGYYPRPMPKKLADEIQKGRVLPSKFFGMKGRTGETANLPSHIRDRIVMENRYRGENGATNILEDFEEYLNPNWGRQGDEFDSDAFDFGDEAAEQAERFDIDDFADEAADAAPRPAPTVGKEAHAQAIADWAHGKPRVRMTGDPLDDHTRYIQKASVVDNTLSGIHEVMYRYARADLEKGIPLADAFRRAGLKESEALRSFASQFGMRPDQARMLKVPEEFVKGATSVIEYFGKGPIWQGKIAGAIDKFNQWFKKWVTIPFLGFISRNFSSGQHLNMATAVKSGPDILRYGKGVVDANRLLSRAKEAFAKGGVESLDQADRQILKELYQYRVIDPTHGFDDVDMMGRPSVGTHPLEAILPQNFFKGSKTRAGEYVRENPITADPFDTYPIDDVGRSTAPALDNIPGVQKARTAINTWPEAMSALNKKAEWYNRVSLYLFFKGKGYSPAQAAKEVIARHFDYGDISDFSRSVMKRVFPFWTFSSKIAPLVTKELMERPGGGIGQTIRATNLAAGGQEEPLPQYVRETTSIPLSKADDGTLRYLTGLGLAHEDPLSFASNAPVRGALLEGISRSNPLLKAPLEWATGESFFQRGPMGGRDLIDMDPTVGRLLTNIGMREEDPVSGRAKPFVNTGTEQILANSPMARALTTLRTATDERKRQNPTFFPGDALALNLLTGLRATDISPAAQDAVIRDALKGTMIDDLGGRAYENVYIPDATIKDTLKRGDADLAEQQRKAKLMSRILQNRAKKRKKEREKDERNKS